MKVLAEIAGGATRLADRARLSRRVVGKYLAGDSDPSRERLIALANAAGVSVEWLATGNGSMYADLGKYDPQDLEDLFNDYLHSLPDVRTEAAIPMFVNAYNNNPEHNGVPQLPGVPRINSAMVFHAINHLDTPTPGSSPANKDAEFIMVPRYEVEASAGAGSIVERESDIGRIAFRNDWLKQKRLNIRELAVIRVIGDSMEPTIKDGALVLVDTREGPPRSDGIYILQSDGHLFAKRIQVDLATGGITILSDNPSYTPIKVPRGELESVRIVGRVVWAGQEV